MPQATTVPICSEFQGAWKCDVWPAGGGIPGVVARSVVEDIVVNTALTRNLKVSL